MKHKWAKEIKSWLDGVKVYGRMDTHKSIIAEFEVTELSQFDIDSHSFYIKPQPKEDWVMICKKCGDGLGIVYEPKEPQYLYVYENAGDVRFSIDKHKSEWKYLGKTKIKLEQDDE